MAAFIFDWGVYSNNYRMSSLSNFDIGPVFASQVKKLRKSFTWWNQLLCRSVLTPNSCTKFLTHSAHADNPGVPNPISSLTDFDIGPVFASWVKNLRKSFTWWNQLLCRSFSTPTSCTKFKIHSAHADHPGFPDQISSLNMFWYWTSLCLTDQETQEELFLVEWTPLQVSSSTKLLYRVQDPFNACRQFRFQICSLGNLIWLVFAS